MGLGQQRLPVLTRTVLHVILMTGKGATTFFSNPHLRLKYVCKVGTKSAKIKQMQEILADQHPLHQGMYELPLLLYSL